MIKMGPIILVTLTAHRTLTSILRNGTSFISPGLPAEQFTLS